MARRVHRAREGGETLIEILISIAILGIIGIALAGAVTTALAGSSTGRRTADADQLLRTFAAGVSAEARSMPWGSGCPVPAVPATTLTLASNLGFKPPSLSVSPSTGQDCSAPDPALEAITLTVAPGTGATPSSLEIWVRHP